ncbi:putative hit finger domain protein [Diaporthe ampelina]|uniref:Putative hit finger domain protein n=1 Tax=Diaporthe ampelina TaxID=1214573 RepID=A0A0G2FWI5_9PEZI|nr:putative hit finger domain protein [Diaporthe ampelina]
MNNFGVIEVASAKTTNAPGWAYVPDTGATSAPSRSVSAVHLHVNRNKRAARNANQAAGSTANVQKGISARRDAKIQKELDELQRDSLGGRDGQIAIPSGGRDRDGKIRGHTPNVRKILASQKTFANHLDDFEAWTRTQSEAPVRSQAQSLEGTPAPSGPTSGASRRPAAAAAAAATKKAVASGSKGKAPAGGNKKPATPASTPTADADADAAMTDAPPPAAPTAAAAPAEAGSEILTPSTRFQPPPCAGDADPLLESWLPAPPADEELRELLRAPPLNYNQARAAWAEDDRRYPARQFCDVCGYWGRVRCVKCGARVCALDCLDVHRDECVTRYGL